MYIYYDFQGGGGQILEGMGVCSVHFFLAIMMYKKNKKILFKS